MELFTITRVTDAPATAIRIQIGDRGTLGDDDHAAGGQFYFTPRGQAGSSHQVNRYCAEEIMGTSSGMAQHFECVPPLSHRPVEDEPEPDDLDDD